MWATVREPSRKTVQQQYRCHDARLSYVLRLLLLQLGHILYRSSSSSMNGLPCVTDAGSVIFFDIFGL